MITYNNKMLTLTDSETIMIAAVMEAANKTLDGWDYIKHEPSGGFFSLTTDVKMLEIKDNLAHPQDYLNDKHFEWACREVQFIARNGYDEWEKKYTKKDPDEAHAALIQRKRDEFIACPTNMTLKQQLDVLASHRNTPMTYSEMRERFG
jgi:hypothetical protein